MKSKEILQQISETVGALLNDHDKAEKGNKSAARRARVGTSQLTKLCKEYRAKSKEEFD